MSTEMQYTLMIMLMRGVQSSCRALDLSIGACLALMDREATKEDALPQPPSDIVGDVPAADPVEACDEESCSHPSSMRTPMRTMGHATRFYCRQCKETIE